MVDYREQYLKSPAAQQQYGVTPGIAALRRPLQPQLPQTSAGTKGGTTATPATSTGTKGGVGIAPPPQINPLTGQAFSAVNLAPQQVGSLLGSKGGAASPASPPILESICVSPRSPEILRYFCTSLNTSAVSILSFICGLLASSKLSCIDCIFFVIDSFECNICFNILARSKPM